MGERDRAKVIANRLLDEPWCDPDDDVRVLARQFERSQDEVERLRAVAKWLIGDEYWIQFKGCWDDPEHPGHDIRPPLLIPTIEALCKEMWPRPLEERPAALSAKHLPGETSGEAVAEFKAGDRARFIEQSLDHGEWVVYRVHDGWVYLHLSTDRCYTHFAKPDQLRKLSGEPTSAEKA